MHTVRAAMSRVGLCALLLTAMAVLLPIRSAAAMDASMALPGDPSFATMLSAEQALIDLTNADRVANGVDPLVFDPDTLSIARERAEAQLGLPRLSHYDSNGQLIFSRMLNDANVPYSLAGENLARSSASNDPNLTARIEQALMHSPTHRKNILEKTFKRLSIGVAIDSQGEIAFAEVYRD